MKEENIRIGWNEPVFGEFEKQYVGEVLDSGYVSEGPVTKELEGRLAKIVGAKYVIMTTSGTSALRLASMVAEREIENGNYAEINLPTLTFLATRNATDNFSNKTWLQLDDRKYLMKIGKPEPIKTYEHDLRLVTPTNDGMVEKFIKAKPMVYVPVNLLGRAVDLSNIRKEDFVICDNAGALGSKVPIGDIGCYSLQGNKIISCGQGGFCATNNKKYAEKIRILKDFGRTNKDDVEGRELNYKYNDILAAVTLGQLHYLEDRKSLLKFQYTCYAQDLWEYGKFPKFEKGEIPLWVEFITDKRDELNEYLKKKNIHCRIPWKPLNDSDKVANYYYENCLWLPNGSGLHTLDLMKVIKYIKEFFDDKTS